MDKLDISLIRIIVLSVTIAFMLLIVTEALGQDVIRTESTTESTITTNGKTETTLKSPPASAISPTINTSNSDLCTFGVAGAVQTQILGISTGTQFTDENCERLKNAKTLYDMGMKVAAVSLMCTDERVFDAMMHAGTPCPYNGMIGEAAKAGWATDDGERPHLKNEEEEFLNDNQKQTATASGGILGLLALLLFL